MMEEDERTKILDHLQQQVPHLEKLIVRLKDPKQKNSELQVDKLEKLHSLITDRKKRLKLDTIRKCRDVMVKILHRTKLKAASPSPPQDVPLLHAPIATPIKKNHKLFRNPNNHLLNMHKNNFKDDEHTATTASSESQSKVKYLRVRRLSGDILSTYQLDGSNNTNSVIVASDESLCKIVNVESQQIVVTEDTHSFPVPISNVTTLSPEKQHALNMPEIIHPIAAVEKLVSTIPVINTVAGDGGIRTVASTTISSVAIPSPLQSTTASSYGFLGQIMPPTEKCVRNDEVIQHQSAQPTKVRIVERLEFEEKPRTEKLTARMSTTQVLQSRKLVFKQTARKSTTQFKVPPNLTSRNRKSQSDFEF